MRAFIVDLENRPGSLAAVAEAVAAGGINIEGVAGLALGGRGAVAVITGDESGTRRALDAGSFTYREVELVSAALDNKPGTLGAAARRLADAGVNVELLTPTGMDGGKFSVAFGVDDADAARQALGELAAAGG
jgi:hypothetical protein